MTHESDGDKKPHYSVVGENVSGEEIKGGHVQEDETLQTVSVPQESNPVSANRIDPLTDRYDGQRAN
jgi:hypothetical protein